MFEPWTLEWYYFSDVECLITAMCGNVELIDELIAMPEPFLDVVLRDEGTGREPGLIARIREFANVRESGRYPWGITPWPFQKLLVCPDVPNKEIIFTPTEVHIPHPFPIVDQRCRNEYEEKVQHIHIEGRTSHDPSRDIRRSVLYVVDELLKEKENHTQRKLFTNPNSSLQQRWASVLTYERERDWKGKDFWGDTFIVPDRMKISIDEERNSNETRIAAESETQLHWHIGLKRADEVRSAWEPQHCGAFTPDCRD